MVRLSTALAQFILAVSYIWSISNIHPYEHNKYSLSLYNFGVGALSAGLGVLRYGNPLIESDLIRPDEKILLLAQALCPTFIAVELFLLHWPESFQPDYFIRLIVFTCLLAGVIWLYETQTSCRRWNLPLLNKNVIRGPAFSVSLALAVCLLNNNVQGCAASLFLAVNTVMVGTKGYVFEMPARDLYSYVQCLCNYHLVRALMD